MNGFSLVLLGIVLFVVGYALWKTQGIISHSFLVVISPFSVYFFPFFFQLGSKNQACCLNYFLILGNS